MPEPAGPATFEDLIGYLTTKPSPYDVARRMPLVIQGLQNLAQRLHDVEACRLEDLDRMQKLESLTAEERTVLTSLEQDRDAHRKVHADLTTRVDTLEKVKPVPAIGLSATSPFSAPEQPKPFSPATPEPFPPATPEPFPPPAPAG